MLTFTDNPAFKRALTKAQELQPQVTEIEPNNVYKVIGSQGDPYTVEFSICNGKLAASCTCPAHTGIDPQTGYVNPNHYPRECYHIGACFDYRREKVAQAAETRAKAANYQPTAILSSCLWCGGDWRSSEQNGPLVIARGYMEHAFCSPDRASYQLVNTAPQVPNDVLCEECKDAPATVEGNLCSSCYDYMRYSDLQVS